MREYFKLVFEYIVPYKIYAALNVFFNILGVLFSLFSFTMLIPFLGILFKTQPLVTEKIAFAFSADALQNNFYYYISKIIIENGEETALVIVSMTIMSMIFLKNVSIYFANYFMAPIRNGVVRDFRNKIFNKILRLPLGYFSDSRKGDIMARMTSDVQEIEWSIMTSLEMVFRDPLNIAIFLAMLIGMNPYLTGFVLVLLPISGAAIGFIGKTLRKVSMKGQAKMGELLSIIDETLGGLRIVKAFNAESKAEKRFAKENNTYYRIANKMMRKRYLASPMSEFFGVAVMIIVMYYGSMMVLDEDSTMKPQNFITYLAIFSQIINPAKSFSTAFYNIQKGLASVDRVNEVLKAEEKIAEVEKPISINSFNDCIEFKNVTFKYDAVDVLKNINLKIPKGKTVALVGQSGSGKSTLVDLLPRFYDVVNGEILIDGKQVNECRIKDLRELMGNVNQESILFNDTFYNNISFGVEHATEQEVIAAAKVANAHEFIIATEDGYRANIGDRGSKLSGGQRQRISIARAVLKNPPIMILDEATSALDTESERMVQDALTNLMKNRTSVVIAHRLSTIKHADEICVLESGKIVERGRHEELIAKDGVYKKLLDLQAF